MVEQRLGSGLQGHAKAWNNPDIRAQQPRGVGFHGGEQLQRGLDPHMSGPESRTRNLMGVVLGQFHHDEGHFASRLRDLDNVSSCFDPVRNTRREAPRTLDGKVRRDTRCTQRGGKSSLVIRRRLKWAENSG
ncbi:hypothetical protein D3C74_376580 [compost metagenome]